MDKSKKLNGENISLCLNMLSDSLIEEALLAHPVKKYRFFSCKYIVAAICILLLSPAVYFSVIHYSPAETNVEEIPLHEKTFTITENKVYQVTTLNIQNSDKVVPLYTYSCLPESYIYEQVVAVRPDIKQEHVIYQFRLTDDNEEIYWYPIYHNGKIIDVVYASVLPDGRVAIGSSEEHVDELNSIAFYTSQDTPMYLASDGIQVYYIIGEKAYTIPNYTGILNEYIDKPIISEKDISIFILE